ncbi:MAG TPA: phosphatase PAP2 family protein [Solirubrobacteraceae bacterium]|nr:phosphatase PAP2 family protein [Solirubrobacteraceae bacterium]
MPGHAYTANAIPPRRPGRSERSGPAGALSFAGLCVLAMALVWAIAELVPAVQFKDALALHDFTLLASRPGVDAAATFLLHLLDPLQFVLWGVALVAVALARERPRVAVAIVALLGLAPLTSETLKPLLAHPHVQIGVVHIGSASWPSGHSTAALSLALAGVLAAPARMRRLVAVIGAGFALAVGCSLLILAWHMPSDVLGGYLVASFWAALDLAALRAVERRWPTRPRGARPGPTAAPPPGTMLRHPAAAAR